MKIKVVIKNNDSSLAQLICIRFGMARIPRKTSETLPFHVNARCINQDWFRIPIDEVWEIFCDYLYFIKFAFELEIHSFVLMSNHFHMIVTTPKGNLSQAMNYFMREVSREITRKSNRINQTFGGPYHASLITNSTYYLHAYKYVYRNPVDAGICDTVEDYKYSTLNGLIGRSSLMVPVSYDETLFSDFNGTLEWLNTEYRQNHRDIIQKALKKSAYKLPIDRSSRNLHELEGHRS